MTEWNANAGGWNPQPSSAAEIDDAVEVVAPPEVQLTVEQKNALIAVWMNDKGEATRAVETEKYSRQEVTDALFPNPKKGTQRYVSPEGFGAIKLVHGWTYTLGDKDKVGEDTLKVPIKDQVDAVLTAIEGLGERGVLIADRCVKWKPELVVSEYEALALSDNGTDAEAKALIDSILSVKPASPQLTFEPPKVK